MIRLSLLMLAASRTYLPLVILCLYTGLANSSDDTFQYNGVFTQGAVYTSDNNFYGQSDDSISFDFTELSLNASYRVSPRIRLAGQVLYRHAGDISDEADIDYLFVDAELFSSPDASVGVRVGRVKGPTGFYNDARDVAFTRPGVFLPQSIYPDNSRDLMLSAESVVFYSNHFTDNGQWNIELGAGKPRLDTFGEVEVKDAKDDNVIVSRVIYEEGGGVWRAGFSTVQGKVSAEFLLPGFPPLQADGQLTLYLLSLQYNWFDWTFTSEYWQRTTELENLVVFGTPVDLNIKETGESYYIQAERRITPAWSAIARWDVDYIDKNDRSGNKDPLPPLLGSPGYGQYTKDYTLGLRWDIQQNMMLNVEYHNIEGASWLSQLDNPEGPTSKFWDMVSIAFSYRF